MVSTWIYVMQIDSTWIYYNLLYIESMCICVCDRWVCTLCLYGINSIPVIQYFHSVAGRESHRLRCGPPDGHLWGAFRLGPHPSLGPPHPHDWRHSDQSRRVCLQKDTTSLNKASPLPLRKYLSRFVVSDILKYCLVICIHFDVCLQWLSEEMYIGIYET